MIEKKFVYCTFDICDWGCAFILAIFHFRHTLIPFIRRRIRPRYRNWERSGQVLFANNLFKIKYDSVSFCRKRVAYWQPFNYLVSFREAVQILWIFGLGYHHVVLFLIQIGAIIDNMGINNIDLAEKFENYFMNTPKSKEWLNEINS